MGISSLIHFKLNLDVYSILYFGIVDLLLLLILMLSCFKFKGHLILIIGMILDWSVSRLIILHWKSIKLSRKCLMLIILRKVKTWKMLYFRFLSWSSWGITTWEGLASKLKLHYLELIIWVLCTKSHFVNAASIQLSFHIISSTNLLRISKKHSIS